MNISEEIKNAYKSGSYGKILNISFPDINYDVPAGDVYFESMKLDEAIFDSDSFEAVGCIASKFEVQIRDTGEELKGERILVSIAIEELEDSEIPLFYGYVDSVNREAQKKMQSIVAYDALYSKGAIDVADWYNNLSFPITIHDFRDSLFDYLELGHEDTTLPNDELVINKEYSPNTLKALSVIKALCQINGCFGIINREGTFEYRFLNTSGYVGTDDTSEDVPYYRFVDYKDYVINPVDKLTIRQDTNDVGITVGDGDNKYIIQGNMFTYNLEIASLFSIANNIYSVLRDIEYVPFNATNNGYPWVEVGKNCVLNYEVYDFENSTGTTDVYIPIKVVALARSMHGIQNVTDEYSAEGQELQREFISDISSDLEILEQTVQNIEKNMSTEITTYRNPDIITISDESTVTIADMVYEAKEGNTILFHEEVSLEVTANESTENDTYTENDVIFDVRYYVNGYRLPNHLSQGTFREGRHLLNLMQFWEAGEKDLNRVQAKLTVTGGYVSISRFMANAYITVKQSPYNDATIKVTKEPDKVTYELGDEIDYTGIIVSKVYTDETKPSEDITANCVFTPAQGTVVTSTEMITVDILYTELNEIGELKTYNTQMYFNIKYLLGLNIEKEPVKMKYLIGDDLDLTGLKITADYADDTVRDVTSLCTLTFVDVEGEYIEDVVNGMMLVNPETYTIQATFTDRGITQTAQLSFELDIPEPNLEYFDYVLRYVENFYYPTEKKWYIVIYGIKSAAGSNTVYIPNKFRINNIDYITAIDL